MKTVRAAIYCSRSVNQKIMEKITLSEFNELAYRAHTGTSFSPEKRRDDIIKSSEDELNGDLEMIPEAERPAYIAGYKKHLSAWLSAKSRCLSTMITGGSNFNVRRANKSNQSEHNRCTEFIEWRDKVLKAIAKRKEDSKPQNEKDNEIWKITEKHILRSCQIIIDIDNGTERGCSRPLIVSNLTNRINTIAKNGNVNLLVKCLNLLKEVNSNQKKPVVSSKSSIWKLTEVAEAKREAANDRANKPNSEFKIENGTVVFNYEIDRLQLLFDGKPNHSVITHLKQNGFKWAPSNMAWQRQLTNNALRGAINVVGEFRQPKQEGTTAAA